MILDTKLIITRKTGREITEHRLLIPTLSGDIYEDTARFLGWSEDLKKPCDPLWYLSMKNIKTIKRITDDI